MDLDDRLRPAGGEGVEKPFALLPRRRGRVANHPAGAKVIRRPRRRRTTFRQGWAGEFRREVGDRPLHMNALRGQRQHQRRFAMPGVHRHPLFMRAEKLFFAVGHVEHVVGDGDEIPVAQAHFPAGDLQDLRLAAVAVDHQQLAKTGPIERFGDLQQGMQQRIAAKGQGAGKMQMLLGLTVDDRRNGVGRDRRRQPGEGMARHAGRYHAVHRAGQMRAVLFDRPGGEDDNRIAFIRQGGHVRPAQKRKKARGRNVTVNHRGASELNDGGNQTVASTSISTVASGSISLTCTTVETGGWSG